MRARVARVVSTGRASGAKKPVRRDFTVRLRRTILMEKTNHVERDMIATRHTPIVVDGKERRGTGKFDVAFFTQFALKRFRKRFTDLDATARQMPAGDVAVLDQKDPVRTVDDEGTYADR